jgi:hypothetical protein
MSKRKRSDDNKELKTELNKIFDPETYNILVSKQSWVYNILIYTKSTGKLCGNLEYNKNERQIFVNMIEKCSLSGTDF